MHFLQIHMNMHRYVFSACVHTHIYICGLCMETLVEF